MDLVMATLDDSQSPHFGEAREEGSMRQALTVTPQGGRGQKRRGQRSQGCQERPPKDREACAGPTKHWLRADWKSLNLIRYLLL